MNRVIILLAIFSFVFCRITKIETSYQDSTTIVEFHKNGKVKAKGTKISKFKHGKWYYYNEKGMLVNVERFNFGRKLWLKRLKQTY